MSIASIDDLRAVLGVGSIYSDAVLQSITDAADVVLEPMLDSTHDTSTCAACQQAALMLAVDIWQARVTANGGSMDLTGAPMPYRLGNSMLGRIRGLIAHALDTGSMVG